MILIRDSNRLVAMAVLGSPRITEAEIGSISAMTDVSEDVLRTIGRHPDWTKRYAVVNNLVRNPKTPTGISLSMVPRLNPRDVGRFAVHRDRRGHGHMDPGISSQERERIAAPSKESRTTPAQTGPDSGPVSSESSKDSPWSSAAAELYRDLVQARLSKARCTACGASLAIALQVNTSTSVGPELNELGLSDRGAARYLAATDDLVVHCGQCGARNVALAGQS